MAIFLRKPRFINANILAMLNQKDSSKQYMPMNFT